MNTEKIVDCKTAQATFSRNCVAIESLTRPREKLTEQVEPLNPGRHWQTYPACVTVFASTVAPFLQGLGEQSPHSPLVFSSCLILSWPNQWLDRTSTLLEGVSRRSRGSLVRKIYKSRQSIKIDKEKKCDIDFYRLIDINRYQSKSVYRFISIDYVGR